MSSRNPKDRPEWMVNNVIEGERAVQRLRQLGFHDPKLLRDALQDGANAYRAGNTANHPAAYAGDRMWGETCASLVVYTRNRGWEHKRIVGVDLIVNRGTSVAVIVTAGDSATGRTEVTPNVRYRREQVITRLVNGSEDSLFDVGERPEWDVYFLLHHVNRERIVPAELSRPRALVKGFVPNWEERILIPDFDDAEPGGRSREEPGEGSNGVIEPVVFVQRRTAG